MDAAVDATATKSEAPPEPAASPADHHNQRKGILSRVWNGVFGRGGEDYEKRLRYLAKEEAAAKARMEKRARSWKGTARNVVVCSVILEAATIAHAVTTTRTSKLDLQMRAIHVLPMFIFPGVSFLFYSTLASFTKMRDRKDMKTLEWLRAERQAKLDELKERTNYYTTQQLIQRYDVDPAAKAAAATVLASKLGADSGIKFFVGDEPKPYETSGANTDVELVPSVGLRNRKHANIKYQSTLNNQSAQSLVGTCEKTDLHDNVVGQTNTVDEHQNSNPYDGGWIARIAAMLVGEDPTQCYALICRNCHMHNGLARKEDFPYVTYYCPHCRALNGPQQNEEHHPDSGMTSNETALSAADVGIVPQTINLIPTSAEAGVNGNLTVGEDTSTTQEHVEGSEKELGGLHVD